MKRDDPQMKIRMPEDLKDFVRQSADANQRTLNAEVVYALRRYQEKAASNQVL